MAPGYYSS